MYGITLCVCTVENWRNLDDHNYVYIHYSLGYKSNSQYGSSHITTRPHKRGQGCQQEWHVWGV